MHVSGEGMWQKGSTQAHDAPVHSPPPIPTSVEITGEIWACTTARWRWQSGEPLCQWDVQVCSTGWEGCYRPMDGLTAAKKRLNPPGRRGTPRMTVPAQRTARSLSPTGDGRPPVGIRTAPGSCESLAFSGFARGREEDGNRLETLHIMWDGMPWGKGAFGENSGNVRKMDGCVPSERRECPSGILFVIAVELVVSVRG